jgi:RimJ/RimL family protein N-acetyltransferase
LNQEAYDRLMKQEEQGEPPQDALSFRRFLSNHGLRLGTPEHFFYAEEKDFCPKPIPKAVEVRALQETDRVSFNEMTKASSSEDLEAGFVELDHPLVFGAFVKGKRVSRSSAFSFDQEKWIFDIGYVTHPNYRNQGLGALCASELTKRIFATQKIPQIRVEPQRKASIGIAKSLGYPFYGILEYDEK